jgi:hypothetical protein
VMNDEINSRSLKSILRAKPEEGYTRMLQLIPETLGAGGSRG